MENKRLSTIASLTKLIKIHVVKYFSMDVVRVVFTLKIKFDCNPNLQFTLLCVYLLLLIFFCNVLRYFRSKGRRLAPFSENFQKEQDKI
jgi:hypothetical protein